MAPVASYPPFPRRYLSLDLPLLSTDRIFRQRLGRSWRSRRHAGGPLVVVAKVKSALRLAALDEVAAARGLSRGQPLADARAMIPGLEAVEEDSSADLDLLESIADWTERYTPLVALNEPYGLMLDITGAAHLFGGEAALLADMIGRLHANGFFARAAIADTPGAASAARFTGNIVVEPGAASEMLRALPLATLRLDAETVFALERVGLKRICQIMDAPRGPLAARFGSELLRRLDQALGREEEAITPRRSAPALIAERRFAEPIVREEDITATLVSLAAALAEKGEAAGTGARILELSLFRVDGAVRRILVGTGRPVRTPRLVAELFREKFAGLAEEIDAGFGFDMVRLTVIAAASVDPAQIDLAGSASGEEDLEQLVDRIGARLGPSRVSRIARQDTHIPEQAVVLRQMDEEADRNVSLAIPVPLSPVIDRPLRLFDKPEPVEAIAEVPDGPPVRFRWRRAVYRVARAEGPERIAAEWWRAGAGELTRDYFRVEDFSGRRFWLFREGLFGRETAEPHWYVHGVFA